VGGEQVVRVLVVVVVGPEVQLMMQLHFWLELQRRKALLPLRSHRTGQLVGELRQQQRTLLLVLELVLAPHLAVR
jgi:hypothetical protein